VHTLLSHSTNQTSLRNDKARRGVRTYHHKAEKKIKGRWRGVATYLKVVSL
jgi:hypothetical protein